MMGADARSAGAGMGGALRAGAGSVRSRVVGAREAVASVLGWPRRTGQGAPVLPASPECARCSVQQPLAQRRLRAHVRAALPSGLGLGLGLVQMSFNKYTSCE